VYVGIPNKNKDYFLLVFPNQRDPPFEKRNREFLASTSFPCSILLAIPVPMIPNGNYSFFKGFSA
jgi:hypothetical protein